MKQKLILIIFTALLTVGCYGQKLSLTDLMNLCSKKDWESVNTFLTSKGWAYYDSKKGDTYQYNIITWSYEKEYYIDKAQAWFYLYTYDGLPNKISYSVFNKTSYSIIQNSILGAGFKLTNSEIEDNAITATYTNNSYILKVSNQKREDDDNSERSTTAYIFSLIKKAGIYDLDNGKKYEYYDNGKIKAEFILKNGEISGILKVYHENGNLQRTGSYTNGKENGSFVEYDELGKISAKYTMEHGEVNGILTIYEDGIKSQEITKINGISNGKFVAYYYDENANLTSKITGNFNNGKKNGKWETIIIKDDKEEIIEYKNFVDDVKNGDFKEYIGNDTIETKHYENDILDGEYKREVKTKAYLSESFIESSFWTLDCEGSYKNGQRNGQWIFYILGQKSEVGNFLNGERVGKWVMYVDYGKMSGEIFCEIEYANGKKNGLSKKYYDTGLELDSTSENISYSFKSNPINEIVNYKNDKKDGEYILKDSTGNLKITGYYFNDLKDKTWKYYNSDKSYYTIDYKNENKQKANYFHETGELFLKEIYVNDNLAECEYYINSILLEKHLLVSTDYGYKVNVIYYYSSKQDSITSYTYKVQSKDEYTHQLFSDSSIKHGEYKFIVNNVILIEGKYCQNQKCGYWIYEYPQSGVYSNKLYKENQLEDEKYFESISKTLYSGKLEIIDNGVKGIIKIKNGLRDGKTIIYSSDGVKVREDKYKKGIKIE